MMSKLLMAMLVVLGACGGSGSKPASGGGKKGKVAKVEKVEDDGGGEEGGESDDGEGDEEGDGASGGKTKAKKPKSSGGKKGWGAGKSRTCLDLSEMPEGASSKIAGAFEKDVLRVCREAQDDDGPRRACIGMDPETGRASKASRKSLAAEAELPAGTLKTDGEKPEACSSDGQCRALGKKATKAVTAALAQEGRQVVVTTDGALVAWADAKSEVWDVAKDKAVKLKAPREATGEYAKSPSFRAVGKHLYAVWTPCAGGCARARVIDAKGKVVVDDLVTEDVPHFLDEKRWSITVGTTMKVFDLTSGKSLHSIELFPEGKTYTIDGTSYKLDADASAVPAIPLSEGRVALLFNGEPVVAIANVDQGKLETLYRQPLCEDPDAEKDEKELSAEPAAGAEEGTPAGGEAEKPAKSKSKSKKKPAKSE